MRLVALGLLIGLQQASVAQSYPWNWAKGIGSTSGGEAQVVNDVAFDPFDQSVYVVGSSEGNNPLTTGLAFTQSDQGFLIKYNDTGAVQWQAQIGDNGEDEATGVAVGEDGTVYVVGTFTGTTQFFSSGSVTSILSSLSSGGTDIFVAAYDPSGGFLWAYTIAGPGDQDMASVAVDATGIVVAGRTEGFATASGALLTSRSTPGVLQLWLSNDDNVFLVRYNLNGSVQWMNTARSTGNGDDLVADVATNGSYIVTGLRAEGPTVEWWQPLAMMHSVSSGTTNDPYITAFEMDGTHRWTRPLTNTVATDNGAPSVNIACDAVYVTGQCNSTSSFAPMTSPSGSPSNIYFFLAKLSDATGIPAQVTYGAAQSGNKFVGSDIAVSQNGAVHVCGSFMGTVNVGSSTLSSTGTADNFVLTFRPSGQLIAHQAFLSTGDAVFTSIATSRTGGLAVAGGFDSSLGFGATSLTSSGNTDGHLALANLGLRYAGLQDPSIWRNLPSGICAGSTVDLSSLLYQPTITYADAFAPAMSGVGNAAGALGAPDAAFATMNGATAVLVLDLTDTVPAGELLQLRFRRNTLSAGATPSFTLSVGMSATGPWTTCGSVSTSNTFFTWKTVAAVAKGRFVRLQQTAGSTTADVDCLKSMFGSYDFGAWTASSGALAGTQWTAPTTAGTVSLTYTVPTNSGGCSKSTTRSITVHAQSVGGTLSSNAPVCPGGTVDLALTGYLGTTLSWTSSPDGVNWNNIANNTATHAINNMSGTLQVAVRVTNGACPSAMSNTLTIGTADTQAPVLLMPSDTTLYLTGANCTVQYDYVVSATDNCGCVSPPAPAGSIHLGTLNGSNYYLFTGAVSRDAAHVQALSMGGHLACIGSAGENQFLVDAGDAQGVSDLWIGLNDEIVEGTFVWPNGEPLVYTNWLFGDPNDADGTADGVVLSSGGWNDKNVGEPLPYLVEIPCGNLTISLDAGPMSGSMLGPGVYDIAWKAEDGWNLSLDTFTVMVMDTVPPIFSNCPENDTLVLAGHDCSLAYVFPVIHSTDGNGCDPDTEADYVTYVQMHDSSAYLNVSGWANITLPQGTHHFREVHRDDHMNTAICNWQVVVVDTMYPDVNCLLTDSFDVVLGAGCQVAFPDLTTYVTATDCNGATIDMEPDAWTMFYGDTLVHMTMWVSDSLGNGTWNNHTIWIHNGTSPTIVCPNDTLLQADPITCSAYIQAEPIAVSGICGATWSSSVPTGFYPPGEYDVTLTATSGPNSDACTYTVLVRDTLVQCAGARTFTATNAGDCTANVILPAQDTTTVDLCGPWTWAGATHSDGAWAVNDTTAVTYKVIDAAGIPHYCIFDIITLGTALPDLSYPTTVCTNGGSVAPTNSMPSTGVTYNCVNCAQPVNSDGSFDPAVLGPGTWTIVVDAPCFTPASDTATVTVVAAPDPSTGSYGPVCAQSGAFALIGTPVGGTWSGAGVMGNMFDPLAAGPGSHTLSYESTGLGGCSETATTIVVVNPNPSVPTITAGGPTTFCDGGSVTLTSSSSTGNLWSNGATAQSITATATDNYSVTVTDGNGCSATSAATTVTVDHTPSVDFTYSSNLFCADGSVIFPVTAIPALAGAYFTGPPGFPIDQITGAITLSSTTIGGPYNLGYVVPGTCPSSDWFQLTISSPSAVINSSGPTSFCDGGSVTLTSSSASGNLWSTGATAQSITVTASGNYYVTVTDGNGCSATSAATLVTVNPNPSVPTITAGGPTTFCDGGSVTLTSSSASGNLWSTGATAQSITVTASGNYYVTVTDGNGCSATSAATVVTVNPNPSVPTITAGGPTTFCDGGSVTLTSSNATGNLWSTGATAQSISVASSGNYSVTVTDGNGCSATSAATVVTVNPNPSVPTITAGGPTTFCDGGGVTLTSSSASGNLWSTGATAQGITVTASGNYYVTVTDGNGCSATSAATTVTVNPNPSVPTITAGGPTTFCDGGSVTLTSSNATGNLWSTGATAQSISVASSGNYSVTVTDGNGCSATSAATTVTVNPNPSVPTITAGGPTTFCDGGGVALTSSSATGNLWSTGATAQSITVTASGNYYVTVTDGNGCSATSTPITTVATPAPTASVSYPATSYCTSGSSVTPTIGGTAVGQFSSSPLIATLDSITGVFNPGATAPGNYTIKYKWSGTGGCPDDSLLAPINVVPAVWSGNNGSTSLCMSATWFDLDQLITSGANTGGLWKKNNGFVIASGIVNPSLALQGTYTYQYITYGAAPCVNDTAFFAITYIEQPSAGSNGTLSVCALGAPVSLFAQLGGSPDSGGSWSGPSPVTAELYDPATMDPGVYTYTVAGIAPCSNSSAEITVNETSAQLWFADTDGDNAGDPNNSLTDCTQPAGYVGSNNDGCPNDPNKIAPGICGCGVGDADTDGDGIADCNDTCPGTTIGDGVNTDGCSCAQVSVDDGIACTTDLCIDGVVTHVFADADSDGVCDANDLCPLTTIGHGVNTDGCSCAQVTVDDGDPCTLDMCANGIVTHTVQDSDNDGTANCNDGCPNDPNKVAPGNCGCGIPDTDADGDGTADCNDGCPNDPDKTAPGICGCGTPEGTCQDCLGVPFGPATEFTSCDDNDPCTVNDMWNYSCVCEGMFQDTDGDTTCDAVDGCPNDPNKIAPGECGCGVSDADTDNDGIADCVDNCPNGLTGTSITASDCSSYFWSADGQTYTQSGTYTYTVGCNTDTLVLTIGGTTGTSITASDCSSYLWSANGQTYTTSGTYTYTVGCNTDTLVLNIGGTTGTSITASDCSSFFWSANGQTYTQSGTYTHTVGCNTDTLVLTIGGTTGTSITASDCSSYLWSANGQTYTASGTYTHTIGCNTDTLVLTIGGTTGTSITASDCSSYLWSANGQTYTASGTYTHTIGCNTDTLVLNIGGTTGTSITASDCSSYFWSADGQTYTQSGTYTYTVGCNTDTLVLTIGGTTGTSITASDCSSFFWSANGQTYTTSGTYTHTVGCNTDTLVLTIGGTTGTSITASDCSSYLWSANGQTYTTSGTYTYTVGCNTDTLVLNIGGTTGTSITASDCSSFFWSANGQTYTQSGTYTHTVGCNTDTLVLTIGGTTGTSITASDCSSYLWSANGQTYTASGTYTHTIGCNTDTLVLTIGGTTGTSITASDCSSYLWSANGQTYTASGTYTHTIGCNTDTLVLNIGGTTGTSITASDCSSYFWSADGQTYTQSGTYTHTVGCNTDTLVLTIGGTTGSSITANDCSSYLWSANGQTYTTSGTYTYTVGCNTDTLVLNIGGTTGTSITASDCSSYLWSANGQTYTTSGTYTHTVGCNTDTLVLNIGGTTGTSITASDCSSYLWSANGQTYTQSGTYTHTVGCNTDTLVLTIGGTTGTSITASDCSSYLWSANGQTYTASGTYTNTVGCNTDTLVLTIGGTTGTSITASDCSSYLWSANGQTYTASGTYTNTVGCNTDTLVLTIGGTTGSSITANDCSSYLWSANGQTYTQSGTYTHTIGCNTDTLVLTIGGTTGTSTTASDCISYFWSTSGQTYTTSGTYTHTVGCNTDTLVLTIGGTTGSSITANDCSSYLWSANGQTYTQSGTYTHTVGCNTDTLVLTIGGTTGTSITASNCSSYLWSANGQTYTASGTYTHTVGCNTDTLVLTIGGTTGTSITANDCSSYLWSADGQTYTQSGTYTHTVGCNIDTLVLTIGGTPDATFFYSTSNFCQNGFDPITNPVIPGGTFTSVPATLVMDALGTVDLDASPLGTYLVTYTVVAGGCTGSHTESITIDTVPSTDWTSPGSVCDGIAPLDLNTLLNSGTAAGGTWSGSGVVGNMFNPNGLLGLIEVTYTAELGNCSANGIGYINITPAPVANAGPDAEVCGLEHQMAATLQTAVGTWTALTGGTIADNYSPTTMVSGNAGVHHFLWTVGDGQCYSTDSVMVTFFDPEMVPTVDAGPDQQLYVVDHTFVQGTTNGTQWVWDLVSGSGNIADPAMLNSEVYLLGMGTNTFVLSASNGPCPAFTDTLLITVNELSIPTGFSPNGDGVNDALVIPGITEYPESTIAVFDRWGRMVYEQEGYRNDWTGRDLPDDTYFMVLNISEGRTYDGYLIIKR